MVLNQRERFFEMLEELMIARYGQGPESLGLDEEMLDCGWAGFQTPAEFLDVLEQEYLLERLTGGPTT